MPRRLVSLLLSTALLGACAATATTTPGTIRPTPDVVAPASPDRSVVRAKLAARRATVVQRFLAYRDARVYPINSISPGFQHVWVDGAGNLCAAATLISGDWGRDAAMKVGIPNVTIQLANVTSGPVMDWILTSGLTHHEIVAIQVPGFDMGEMPRESEVQRLYTIYVDVERQLSSLASVSLGEATDALLARPDLARAFLATREG